MTRPYYLPSGTTQWQTPQFLFELLDAEFHFTLDAAATHNNAKCEKYYTREDNALIQSWSRERVFINPPYGVKLIDWVKKAYEETHCDPPKPPAEIVVMLLPARTDTIWFHDYVLLYAEVRWVRGRLKFLGPKGLSSAPFPSIIVIFTGETTLKCK